MIYYEFILSVTIVLFAAKSNKYLAHGETQCKEKECSNIDKDKSVDSSASITTRLVTEEELLMKTGENKSPIWLSVMGQVYDVTFGEHYYGKNSSYSFFAAKDASASFATGKFNDEGLKEDLTKLEASQINEIEHWRLFYEDHENYVFVGHLIGKFYDEEGEPTSLLLSFREKLKKFKLEGGEQDTY